jgi:hypothetical protein
MGRIENFLGKKISPGVTRLPRRPEQTGENPIVSITVDLLPQKVDGDFTPMRGPKRKG